MEDPDATILQTSVDFNVDDILLKYGIGTTTVTESNTIKNKTSPKISKDRPKLKVYELSSSESEDELKSPIKKNSKKVNLNNSPHSPNKTNKISRKKSPNKVDPARKALLALERAQKKQDAENKKLEAAKHKEIKKMMSEANKQLKPEECLKFVTAIIDENITNKNTVDLTSAFKELGSNYQLQSQIIPNTITWTRKLHTHQINDDCGTLKPIVTVEELPDVLLILTSQELFEFIKQDKLMQHIKTIESIFVNKSVSLGVLGLDKEVKNLKGKQGLSYTDVMTALTEIQIFCNCCYRNLNGPADLLALLCQFTKAIAQRPYKLQQQEKYAATNWYMKGDNKDCVKVDKKGNGLKRLWQQQITAFPLARLETAESIIEKYPTLPSLMEVR